MNARPGQVVCIGELLVDFVQDSGNPDTFRRAAGGAPANVAAQVALLGGRSAFVGRVGGDAHGHWLKESLAATGVDVSGVALDQDAPTTLAFVTVGPGAERSFSFHRNGTADTRLATDDLQAASITGASIVHACSVSLSVEPARSTTLLALQQARESGALVSFDVNWRESLWPDPSEAQDVLRQAMALADIIKLSAEELGLFGATRAAELLHGPTRLVLLTRGAAGVELAARGFSSTVPGFMVAATDTTGAGDSLAGAFLAELAANPELLGSHEELCESLRRACAAAALSTMSPGAIPSYPDRARLESFLAQA